MSWLPVIGAGISAVTNLIAGNKAADAQAENNRLLQQQADKNMKLQKDFAQEGIRWKVEDARQAGIHPLYALGASTTSYSPVNVGTSPITGAAQGLANAGQDISRAINATRTAPERSEAQAVTRLQLEGMSLDNDIKRATYASAVQRLQQAANPPIPTTGPFNVPEANKSEERQPLMVDGSRLLTDPGTSPAKAWEDQLGDDVMSPGFLPNLVAMIKKNTEGMSFSDILKAIDRKTAVDWGSFRTGK